MARYEIYAKIKSEKENNKWYLKAWTDDIDYACDLGHEIENKDINVYATMIRDTLTGKFFGYHESGRCYIIA